MTRQFPNRPRRAILAALALAAATAIAGPAPAPAAGAATAAGHARDTRQETSPEREITTKPIRVDRKDRVCHCARGPYR